ncbi:unnamed protein product [Mucor hiemalis]
MNSAKILLVGLGNTTLPNTRHNVGMMALDSIAKALNLTWSQNCTWKSDTAETTIKIETKQEVKEYHVTFLKPRKLMNISGSCVAAAVKDLHIPVKNLYVFHDDMQRELVIDNLRTNEFKRVRIGIGRPPSNIDNRSYDVVASFVLGKFTQGEITTLEDTVYPMWTKNQGLELLCDRGELFKKPKIKNKHANPNKLMKKAKEVKVVTQQQEEPINQAA